MKRILLLGTIFLIIISLSSCFREDSFSNTKKGNFEALWKIMDERYCFFEYKEIDWNKIYDQYAQRIDEHMPEDSFFDVLAEMLAEVKDGHVNLVASHNVARYWKWYEDFPDNFDEKIIRKYIGTDYGIASGLKYKLLEDNIGYINYSDFSNAIGDSNLDQVLSRFSMCHGLIIDVRNNGGGLLTNVDKIASRFFNKKTLVGYIVHKKGKGHNDFSKPYERYIEPSSRIRFQKDVVILTNRKCYSATNDFINAMKYAPNVTIIGDRTGGGSGLPFSSELPNGWLVRFSASPMLNAEKKHIEFGIDPDIWVEMTKEDMDRDIDTIIEKARELLNSNLINK